MKARLFDMIVSTLAAVLVGVALLDLGPLLVVPIQVGVMFYGLELAEHIRERIAEERAIEGLLARAIAAQERLHALDDEVEEMVEEIAANMKALQVEELPHE